jgi:enamine deaminase RidA (YjgF/YER057c/UK114 family)
VHSGCTLPVAPQPRERARGHLAQAGGRPEHIVRLTWYVIDREEYLAALAAVGRAYRELMGKHYPAMTVVQVSGLVEAQARLEIEATAVIPE